MAKKVEPKPDDIETVEYPECKKCHKPIKNPNGDNGCGIHTVAEKTVTNCIPVSNG
jgi:hypothetical protein